MTTKVPRNHRKGKVSGYKNLDKRPTSNRGFSNVRKEVLQIRGDGVENDTHRHREPIKQETHEP